MSVLHSTEPLRPSPGGLSGWVKRKALAAAPFGLRLLRSVKPILKLGSFYIVTRYDDVIEVFRRDGQFDTPYKENIEVLTGGEPFFLGMRDTEEYRDALAAMHQVMLIADVAEMGDRAEALATEIVEAANGRLEIVDDLVRKVTFTLYSDYLGIPEPDVGHLDVWSTRLFEFQFAGSPKDVDLRAQVDEIAPAFRDHIDQEIKRRHKAKAKKDDVLGRCLKLQTKGKGKSPFSDLFIRTNLLCMMVGGPPQLPMVAPHALEQLLRRTNALKQAATAARSDKDAELWTIVREAMRFDPLAPGLPRIATDDLVLAKGTKRKVKIPKGATVMAAFSSAMMDKRRLPEPKEFNADRLTRIYPFRPRAT